MFSFEFKKRATEEIDKVPIEIRERILKKIKFYSSQKNPLKFAEKLRDYRFGGYRFRIGDYRALFDVKNLTITILKVGHRKDIYKDC